MKKYAGFVDRRRHAWYDRLIISRKPEPSYELFNKPIGEHKPFSHTNMLQGNVFPPPLSALVERIICIFASENSDSEQFRTNYVFEFRIDQKTFAKIPLRRFPLWGKLEIEEFEVPLDGKMIKTARPILPDITEPWCHEMGEFARYIAPEQPFGVRLTGEPFPVMDTIDVMILLDGLSDFSVQ